MAGPKNVEIRVTGSTDASLKRATSQAESALDKFAAAQRNTAKYRGLIDNQRDTAAAAKAAAIEIKALGIAASGDQVRGFRAATTAAKQATDQLEAYKRAGRGTSGGSFASFDTAISNRAGIEQAARSTEGFARALALTAANQSRLQRIAAFEENARGARSADAAVEALAEDLPKLAAAQKRVTQATNESTAAFNRQSKAKSSPSGGGLAGGIVDAAATRNSRGPLGLRPYELQNLSYQVNDFFTQIASGTPATQAFAQQFGQVAQLFPAAISGFLRLTPAIALVTAALSPFISALIESNNQVENLKTFEKLLTSVGNGSKYSSSRLADLATSLDEYGGSLGDARAALAVFVRDDVAPQYLERFGKTALNLSKVLKIDVVDAAGQVSQAFTGNASDVLSLDDKLSFLSSTERDHIELLKKSGKEAQARTEAFAIFERRYSDTAAKMRGPWSTILSNFDRGWKDFVHTVNFVDFSAARAEINGLLGLIARLTGNLSRVRGQTIQQVDSRISELEAANARDQRDIERIPALLRAVPGTMFLARQRQGRYSRELQDLYSQRDRLTANAEPPPADTTLKPPDDPKLPKTPKVAKTDEQRAAEALAKAQKEFNDDLLNANTARARGIELLGETARETAILQAIEEARKRAADGHLTLTTKQEAAIRASVGAVEDAKAAQDAFNKVSEQSLALAEARGEVETRDAFIRRNLAEENIAIQNKTNRVVRAARIDQLNQTYDAKERALAEKKVNDLIAQRSAIQAQITFLQDNGMVAQADALQASLLGVNQQIIAAAQNMLTFLTTMRGPEIDAFRLRLQGIIGDAQVFGQVVVTSGKQINDSIAEKGTAAFDRFSQAVADGENVFTAARDAFLQFAADFLREIALMIIKQAILNALGGGSGQGGGAGGGIAGFINGLFRHEGGKVGSGGGFKPVNPAVFAGAMRYHSGGIAGLKPGEIPTVLKRGEVVDPGDGSIFGQVFGGGGKQDVKVVNVFDPAELLDRALNSDAGERIMMNFVQRNGNSFKASIS